jgi:hypothetical protein
VQPEDQRDISAGGNGEDADEVESEAGGGPKRRICTHSCLPEPRPRTCTTALTVTRTGAWQGHMGNYAGLHPNCQPGCPGFTFVEQAWEMPKMPIAPLLVLDPLAKLLPDEHAFDNSRFVHVKKGEVDFMKEVRARFLDSDQETVLPEFEGYVEVAKNKNVFLWEWVCLSVSAFCHILRRVSFTASTGASAGRRMPTGVQIRKLEFVSEPAGEELLGLRLYQRQSTASHPDA